MTERRLISSGSKWDPPPAKDNVVRHERDTLPSPGRALGLALATLALLWLLPAAGLAHPDDAPLPQAITVVADDNYPPYIFRDPAGQLQGILVDEWRLWEAKTGIRARLVAMDWGKAQQFMRDGRADVIDTIFYNDERARIYDFSKPYATLDVPVFFHKTLSGITDIASLQGFTIGVKSGDACIEVLKSHGITTLKEFDSYEEIVRAAADNKVRVFSIDKPPALYYLYKLNVEDDFRQSFILYTGEFHRAVHKGQAELLRTVEDGFAKITRQEREAIERKWLGAPLVKPEHVRVFVVSALAVGGVILLLGFFNLTLKRTVRAKTAELNRLLDELRLSEEKYRSLVENLNVGVFRSQFGKDARYLQVNPALAKMLGYDSCEELMRTPVVQLYADPDERDRLLDRVVRQGLVKNEEVLLRKKDGVTMLGSISSKGQRDAEGSIQWLDGTVEDITERKRAEEQLREREQMLRSLGDNLPNGAIYQIAIAPDGTRRFRYVSQGIERLTGVASADGLRDAALLYAPIHPDDLPGLIQAENQALAALQVFNAQGRVTAPDGATRWVQFRSAPRRQPDGTVIFDGVVLDITELKQVEAVLQAAKQGAEAANLAKNEFLANMSHELRTPLNGVLGMLHLLDETPLGEDQKMLVEIAIESGRSLLTIISDILNLAQIEAGKVSIVREEMDARGILDSVARAFHHEAQCKGLTLTVRTSPAVPARLLGDSGRLRQILFNLIGNALKFTERGGIVVEVSLLPHSPVPTERVLLFSVADTGIGVPEDKLGSIFEPFTQVDGSLTRKYQGTGIGLGIVRNLVRLMGGSVAVESEEGLGTTVYFTIRYGEPLPDSGPAQTVGGARSVAFTRLKVLLAEDDRVNRIAATRFLERLGCTVLVAGNGRMALELLEENPVDCIIMDVQMPEMDGMAATRAIRGSESLGAKARVPIIAMTAHAMPGDREKFLAAGMDGYISKPVEMDELVRVLTLAVAPPG